MVNADDGNIWIFAVKLQQLRQKLERSKQIETGAWGRKTRNINVM